MNSFFEFHKFCFIIGFSSSITSIFYVTFFEGQANTTTNAAMATAAIAAVWVGNWLVYGAMLVFSCG